MKEKLVAKCFRATIRRILRKLFQVSESGMRIRNASVRLKVKFAKVNQRRKERRRDENTRKQKKSKNNKTTEGKGGSLRCGVLNQTLNKLSNSPSVCGLGENLPARAAGLGFLTLVAPVAALRRLLFEAPPLLLQLIW